MSDDYPGKRVIEALGWGAGPGLEFEVRDIASYFAEFSAQDKPTADPAFRALRLIESNKAQRDGDLTKDLAGISPDASLEIPWWIVAVLSERWADFLNAGGVKTLGQAFGVEGRGQGRHRAPSVRSTEREHWGYAIEVAWEVKSGTSVTAAKQIVSERWNKAYDTINDIWKKHGSTARSAVKKGGKLSKSTP